MCLEEFCCFCKPEVEPELSTGRKPSWRETPHLEAPPKLQLQNSNGPQKKTPEVSGSSTVKITSDSPSKIEDGVHELYTTRIKTSEAENFYGEVTSVSPPNDIVGGYKSYTPSKKTLKVSNSNLKVTAESPYEVPDGGNESYALPKKTPEVSNSNEIVTSYSPPKVKNGGYESYTTPPKKTTEVRNSSPQMVMDGGNESHTTPKIIGYSANTVETNNGSSDRFVLRSETKPAINYPKESEVSKNLTKNVDNNDKPRTIITNNDITGNGEFTEKGQTKTIDSYGGSDETVEKKPEVKKDPFW